MTDALSNSTLDALVATLPAAAPRVLRARLRYAGTNSSFGGWDVLFDGSGLQLRITVKARAAGGASLAAAYRPRGAAAIATRVFTANGGWNALLFSEVPAAGLASDFDAILAAVRLRLHEDERADRLLAA